MLNQIKESSFVRLFFKRKFELHRLLGLWYLIQWVLAFYYYWVDFVWFKGSFLVWSLPFTGIFQSINASFYFRFLPKQQDPGYFSDKSVMSYSFVVENIYFAGQVLFHFLYMSNTFYKPMFQDNPIVENILVFLPYIVIRPFFPKTRFRDSLDNSDKNKTMKNRLFFVAATWVTKLFYIFAKHNIGFLLNYLRFLNLLNPTQIQNIYFELISSSFAVTVGMFLHTLKFKKYMGPKLSFIIYQASYLSILYSYYLIFDILFLYRDLTLICFFGMFFDFTNIYWKAAYQITVMVILNLQKENIISPLSVIIPNFINSLQ